VPAIQLELNTRLLMNGYDITALLNVWTPLCEITQRLNSQPVEIAL
jgi:hypothetical protein